METIGNLWYFHIVFIFGPPPFPPSANGFWAARAISRREKTLKSPAAISLYVRRLEIFQKKSRGERWKAFPYIYYIVQTRFTLNNLARGLSRPNSCFFCRCAVIWATRTTSIHSQVSRTPHQLEKNLFFGPWIAPGVLFLKASGWRGYFYWKWKEDLEPFIKNEKRIWSLLLKMNNGSIAFY